MFVQIDPRTLVFAERNSLDFIGVGQFELPQLRLKRCRSLTQVETDPKEGRVHEIAVKCIVTPHPVEEVISIDEYSVTHDALLGRWVTPSARHLIEMSRLSSDLDRTVLED